MPKKYFIFRNATVENLFSKFDAVYSGYNDISYIPDDVDAYFWVYLSPVKTNVDTYIREIEAYALQLQWTLSLMKPQKACYAFTIHQTHYIYHENSNRAINAAIKNYNDKLYRLSETHSNLKIIDFSRFCGRYPVSSLIDWRFYYISQMQVNPKLAGDFDIWIQKEIAAIEGNRKKCLILDLDNTLWGGILGEDGIEGIQIGNTYPGNAFLDFQNNILELSKSGAILAVCSKNNEKDVFDAWEQNPFLQIKKEQLAAWRINWNDKATNIIELSKELNIGLDSMVFVDDNPAERELIKQMLPMVEAPDFPEKPYLLPDFFGKICREYFQIYQLTKEDKEKLSQYKANTERSSFQKLFTSFDDYLKSLEIVLEIQAPNTVNLPRIAQMTQKTNQFNLTTKRYTDDDIRTMHASGARIYCLSESDRFGDNGMIGVAIVKMTGSPTSAEIDSFLLSCRVLGKNIENVFLKYILKQLKQEGVRQMASTYVPTLKNSQASNFYDNNGFTLGETHSEGVQKYSCSMDNLDTHIPDIYQIKLYDRSNY